MKVSGPGAFSIQSECAWTLIRYAPAPNAGEASTIPVVSHDPQLPSEGSVVGAGPTSVGPASADWSILATACAEVGDENGTYHRRAVVALGSAEFAGNWLLPPGSSVTRRPVAVVSTLSGWWISPGVWTALSSPSRRMDSESTCVGSSGSRTIFQMRPLVDLFAPGSPAVARPVSAK